MRSGAPVRTTACSVYTDKEGSNRNTSPGAPEIISKSKVPGVLEVDSPETNLDITHINPEVSGRSAHPKFQ